MGSSDGDRNELVCQEARHTLNQQIRRIDKADQKAISLLRVNLLLAGIIISFLTLAEGLDGIEATNFLNIWSIFGVILLFLSLIMSAMTYTSSGYEIGISPKMMGKVEGGTYATSTDFQNRLISLYEGWLRNNGQIARCNAYFITVSLLLAIDSVIFLIGGMVTGSLNTQGEIINYLAFAAVIIFVIPANLAIWWADMVITKITNDDCNHND